MNGISTIPSFGYARGAVVRLRAGGPNMLVIRGLGETTAVITIMGDESGNLRLFDVPTSDLEQVVAQGPVTEAAQQALADYFARHPLKIPRQHPSENIEP